MQNVECGMSNAENEIRNAKCGRENWRMLNLEYGMQKRILFFLQNSKIIETYKTECSLFKGLFFFAYIYKQLNPK